MSFAIEANALWGNVLEGGHGKRFKAKIVASQIIYFLSSTTAHRHSL
jgi:hypothetical protein